MKRTIRILVLTLLLIVSATIIVAQTNPQFDVSVYKQFLSSHQNMSAQQLLSLHPAGIFEKGAATQFVGALYSDSIQIKYALTSYEKSLIGKNGFMVTERLSRQSFGTAFEEIYNKDLPVFVSTDAMLHAMHMSMDGIIQDIEESILIPKLDSMLALFHAQLPALAIRYAAYPGMKRMLQDVDLYLTVPRKLLNSTVTPVFTETSGEVAKMMEHIKSESPCDDTIFSSTPKTIDFSQFTVRGHYTQSKQLSKYFQALMWLGRMEIYLIAPKNASGPEQTKSDIQRQIIDAVLIAEVVETAKGYPLLGEIERILQFFIGESDNVALPHIRTLMELTKTDSAHKLLDTLRCRNVQDTLKQKSWAFQKILSQILISDMTTPEAVQPASAFLLLGQRFIIDSYIACNVVFDKILYNNQKVWRALPSRYDFLFALGNDAAGQLLEPELNQYKYSSNLAALTYLVESYEPQFWKGSIYNNWLNSIRTLNPPQVRNTLPKFMQTAAWWQEKMTTQLASWAELRHDFLLYAKQSYTGGGACSFPESYVEPNPEFYRTLKEFATIAKDTFNILIPSSSGGMKEKILHYWTFFGSVADTLESISRKELAMSPLTDNEREFLAGMIRNGVHSACRGGDGGYERFGWYAYVFYGFVDNGVFNEGYTKQDYIVADVHTCPYDYDTPVGWVMHAGTGSVNLAIVTTESPGGKLVSYIGPVSSYYEHVSVNFKRLTDEEWQSAYQLSPSFRPDFVNLYSANPSGNSRGTGASLLTGISDRTGKQNIPATMMLGQNYPNPFNPTTIITLSISLPTDVQLTIYNAQGQRVRRLLNQALPSGNYAVRWDGKIENGLPAASGVYFYSMQAGKFRETKRMVLMK